MAHLKSVKSCSPFFMNKLIFFLSMFILEVITFYYNTIHTIILQVISNTKKQYYHITILKSKILIFKHLIWDTQQGARQEIIYLVLYLPFKHVAYKLTKHAKQT